MSFWQGKTKIDAADRLFSLYIRERDWNRCKKCGVDGRITQLECSHFWGRRMESVRFDPENADTFCRSCHAFMEAQKGEGLAYWNWKMAQLGPMKFSALQVRAHTHTKKDRRMSLLCVKAMMVELKKTRPAIIGAKA